MAFRRSPGGPHYDPNTVTPAPRKANTLGPGQNLRNSMPPGLSVAQGLAKNLTVNGVNRAIANFFRRAGRY